MINDVALKHTVTVPASNSCTKCVGSPSIIHEHTHDCHPVSWACMHEWPHNWTYLWFASYVGHCCIVLYWPSLTKQKWHYCLSYTIDLLFVVVCTTRHWHTSGRLVQELNVCTVDVSLIKSVREVWFIGNVTLQKQNEKDATLKSIYQGLAVRPHGYDDVCQMKTSYKKPDLNAFGIKQRNPISSVSWD